MKKIMSLMLGLSLVLGTVAFAADEKPAADKTTTKKKGKKAKTAKPADAPAAPAK
jgi:hypothetical protein